VERVIAQQAPRAQRRAIADAVIHNGEATTLQTLAREVRALWAVWVGGHASGPPVEQ
jgi:dephospho-CoA kinase